MLALHLTEIIGPIFIILLAGILSVRLRLFNKRAARGLSRLAYYIVLPAVLFFHLSRLSFSEVFYWPYILAYLLVSIILSLLTAFISKKVFQRNNAETIINVMACYHTNTAFIALPIFIMLFDSASPVASVIVLQTLFTVFIVTGLEMATGRIVRPYQWRLIPYVFIKNPITMASLLGVTVGALTLKIPTIMENTVGIISQSGTFLALFALGISLSKDSVPERGNRLEIGYLLLIKSVVHPLLGWIVGKFCFHLEVFWLTALVLMCAMPTAQNVFVFSQKFKVGTERSNVIVLLTTLVSFFSIILTLVLLSAN